MVEVERKRNKPTVVAAEEEVLMDPVVKVVIVMMVAMDLHLVEETVQMAFIQEV